MPKRRSRALALASLLALSAWAPAGAGATSGANVGYSYVGLQGNSPVSGVSALIGEAAPAQVGDGHVLAWVGVGGENMGPGGSSEWIQAGIAAFPGQPATLYYELMQPGSGWTRVTFGSPLAPGELHRITVLEIRPNVWQVRVDGASVSPAVRLARSHDAWVADALVESQKGLASAVNSYDFRFLRLRVRLGSSWLQLSSASTLRDAGARLNASADGFEAAGSF